MTGARLELSFNDKALSADLRRKIARLKDKAPLLKSIGEEMLPRINKRFKEESDPDGKKWAPLASPTIAARLKRYGNAPVTIMRMRGHLAGSINYQVAGSTLTIGTGDEVEDYAAIHQFGGKAGRGRKVKIKARPYLGFGGDDMDILEEEVSAYFGL
jgi:phage virion morphogenesis protein